MACIAFPLALPMFPAARSTIPPGRSAFPPTSFVIPPRRFAIPPARSAIPPSHFAIPPDLPMLPPDRFAFPSSEGNAGMAGGDVRMMGGTAGRVQDEAVCAPSVADWGASERSQALAALFAARVAAALAGAARCPLVLLVRAPRPSFSRSWGLSCSATLAIFRY